MWITKLQFKVKLAFAKPYTNSGSTNIKAPMSLVWYYSQALLSI